MTEVRFHRSLYAGTSVDEAVKVYARFGTFALSETPTHWNVQVTCASEARERLIARELSNYALGLTVRSARAAA